MYNTPDNSVVNPEGVCLGIAYTGMLAMLTEDVDTFNARLNLIHSIPAQRYLVTLLSTRQLAKVFIDGAKTDSLNDMYQELKITDGSL